MAVDLIETVQKFRGRRVLLVGDVILDRYVYGDAERISPEAPVPVLRTVEKRDAVGGTANVAACIAALGCRVSCCGTIGNDQAGETIRKLLREREVETEGLLTLSDRPTTTKTRMVGLAQHRHRQQLIRVDEEDTRPLAPQTAEQFLCISCRYVQRHDVVCIEDYDKGLINASLVKAVLAEARRHGRRVLVDPARLADYERYRGVDVVTPNRDELALVSGRSLETITDVAEAARDLINNYDVGAVVATVDRDGAVLVEPGQDHRHLTTLPRSVYDNTGAGDAVLAMLAAAVSTGASLETAVKLANVAGGLEVEKFGCVPITAEEVLAEIRLETRTRNGKLRTEDQLVAELTLRRDRGETVAFTNGCFDILHAGHVDFLQRCRREASLLVIGLNTDGSIRSLDKAGNRPINKFEHRAVVLSALECVDYVVGFEQPTPESLIRRLRPNVLIKGKDWADKGIVGAEFVESIGGRIVLLPLVEGLSTTAVINRIRNGA